MDFSITGVRPWCYVFEAKSVTGMTQNHITLLKVWRVDFGNSWKDLLKRQTWILKIHCSLVLPADQEGLCISCVT